MSKMVEFKFSPMQFVKINAYDLHYKGRVMRCEFNGHQNSYNVEYASDGKIEARTFYEDEIE